MTQRIQQKRAKATSAGGGRGRPRRYSEDDLIEAALRVMGRDGYTSLTIRALAEELGTTHSALYTYVAAIDELEEKAVHRLTDRFPLPTAATPGELRRQLIDYLLVARGMLKLHPGVVLSRPGSATSEIFREISDQWNRALLPHAPDAKTVQLALGSLIGSLFLIVEGERLSESGGSRKVGNRTGKASPDQLVAPHVVVQYLDDLIGLVLPGLGITKSGRKPARRRSSKQ